MNKVNKNIEHGSKDGVDICSDLDSTLDFDSTIEISKDDYSIRVSASGDASDISEDDSFVEMEAQKSPIPAILNSLETQPEKGKTAVDLNKLHEELLDEMFDD